MRVIQLTSRDFRDQLFHSINSRPRQVMSAEAEIHECSDLVTIYKRGFAKFIEVTPIYALTPESNPTLDLFVESGTPGVYAPDFLKFLETKVNSDEIFSPGNPLHSNLRENDLEQWKRIFRRVPPLTDEPKMTCSINFEIKNKNDHNFLMNAFYHYMGHPVLFYLYRMGEFAK